MKKEHRFIYYGIIFLFLYLKIYSIIGSWLACLILSLKGSIFLIPIGLGILIIGLITIFCTFKSFPKLRLWVILIVILLLIITNILFIPSKYYLGGHSLYTLEERTLITSFILYSDVVNTVLIILVSCIKYFKAQKTKEEIHLSQ